MSLKNIAQLVKRSIGYCGKVCQDFINTKKARREPQPIASRAKRRALKEKTRKSWELSEKQIAWLIDQGTLERQIGMSLKERCAHFISKNPDRTLSASRLQRIYAKNLVRKKDIKVTKVTNSRQRRRIRRQAKECWAQVQSCASRGFRILCLDEMMVTKSTIQRREWSSKGNRFEVDHAKFSETAVAALASVSAEMGLEHLMMFDRSVNKKKFWLYLQELRDKWPFDDICLYMDNLGVHVSKETKERMDELGFEYVYGPAYSPDFNGIESVFSLVKAQLKRRRWQAIRHGRPFEIRKEMKQAFENVDEMKIAACVNHSFKLLKEHK